MARRSLPRGSRWKRGTVQLAVWSFRHPESGRHVTLVNMSHFADRTFYTHVRELIDWAERNHAVIQYEYIRKAPPAALADASPREREAIRQFAGNFEGNTAQRFAPCGLLVDSEMIPPQEHWQNPDVDDVTVVRLNGAQHICAVTKVKILPAFIANDPRRFRGLIAAQLAPSWQRPRFAQRPRLKDKLDPRITADRRTDLAVLAALGVPRDTPVLAMWGAAHGTRYRTMLERNGFVLTRETWVDAIAKKWAPETVPEGTPAEDTAPANAAVSLAVPDTRGGNDGDADNE